MRDFISEDDTGTFEGWLNYQAVEGSALTTDELAMWRGLYDEARRSSSGTAPIGLMKLGPMAPGEHRYAVALRDGPDLWLTLWVRRSQKGEFFVMVPRRDKGWDPHTSYHRDGTLHAKSYGKASVGSRKLQPLTGAFRGTAHLGIYAGHGPKKVGAICDPTAFSGVIEFPPGVLGPVHGAVAIDLIEPGYDPMPFDHIIRRDFSDTLPWLVVRIAASHLVKNSG
jgi:hypothetical protein